MCTYIEGYKLYFVDAHMILTVSSILRSSYLEGVLQLEVEPGSGILGSQRSTMTWDGLETHSGFSSLEWSGDQPGEMRAMLSTILTQKQPYSITTRAIGHAPR